MKPAPTIWFNVTTSSLWDRPPVGIVRVEQALCAALLQKLGPGRLRPCVWRDGAFVAAAMQEARPSQPQAGDVLITLGLDWDMPYHREFMHLARDRGIHLIGCLYDLIPILYPQYCVGDVAQRFKDYLNLLTWSASAVLCISEHTRRDFIEVSAQFGAPPVHSVVMQLGDHLPEAVAEAPPSPEVQALLTQPFILYVSTIERRKNHEVLYRACHLLCRAGRGKALPKLVFVGMPGWHVGDLLHDLAQDPATGEHIVLLHQVSDAELRLLYQQAKFCLYPSIYEGWGLPVGEALALGKVVLASSQASIPEVGGDLVRYVSPWNAQAWADAILEFTAAPALLAQWEARVRSQYRPRRWEDTADTVLALIEQVLAAASLREYVLLPGYDFSTEVGLPVGAAMRSTGHPGVLLRGPQRALAQGRYCVTVYDDPTRRTHGTLRLQLSGDQRILWEGAVDLHPTTEEGALLEFELQLEDGLAQYDLVGYIDDAPLTLTRVVLRRVREGALAGPIEPPVVTVVERHQEAVQPENQPPADGAPRQFLVDVSELIKSDNKSGIQRVVRSILAELLKNPPAGFAIAPVYTTGTGCYFHARDFDGSVSGPPLPQEILIPKRGDLFLGLDLLPVMVPQQADFYAGLRNIGVDVYFVAYDLLPLGMAHYFSSEAEITFTRWLETLAQADGIIAISRATADDIAQRIARMDLPPRERPLKLGWFHLGADMAASLPSTGLPPDAPAVLAAMAARISFLMVGTIEPRKGHRQTLEAFERLWDQGVEVNLVIVGKKGWRVDALSAALRRNAEQGQRLFWLDDASDEYLEKIYAHADCLIAASEGEGFGLPLIEAARHGLPIIARDLPVFHEVAGEHAHYFADSSDPDVQVESIRQWLQKQAAGSVPRSEDMPWLNWQQSTAHMLDVLLHGHWYRQ